MNDDKIDRYLEQWRDFERCAEAMLPIVGRLYRERGVIVTCYGNSLVNKDPVEIIQHHSFASRVEGKTITVQDTLPILAAVNAIDLAPARIDIGNFLTHYRDEGHGRDLTEFAGEELASVATGKTSVRKRPQDIVLYGFGRIGRLVARILVGKTGGGDRFRLRAIVVRSGGEDDLAKRASLLRRDSVHGPFRGSIHRDEEENAIVANGNMIRVLYADAPDKIDYTEHDIENAILIDNTGKWRDREGLELHLKAPGIAKVLLTAPGKGDIANIVYGVNHKGICDKGPILSAASCTTNAIVPVLDAINREFGIDHGHVESCHSYTNDQNLIDNYHKNARRGRSAALNMVVTETGAAKAVGKALPELEGKFTGNAVRVPTPNVSLEGDLVNQIDYTNADDVVSTDFVGNRFAGIVDSQATISQGKSCVLYVWYDNEFGYSRQVVRVLEELAGLGLPTFPKAT
jgi:glyceraldehyde 3-phosphate dehydrogenase